MRGLFKTMTALGALMSSASIARAQKLELTGRVLHLPNWPYTTTPLPIAAAIEKRVAKACLRRGEYVSGSQLSDSRVCEILDALGSPDNKEDGSYMTLAQALSLRKQLLVSKIVNESWKLRENIPKIAKQYERGRSIVEISEVFDLPAMAVLRSIFTTRAQGLRPDMYSGDVKESVKIALRKKDDDTEETQTQTQTQAEEDSGIVPETTNRRERDIGQIRLLAAELLDDKDMRQLAEAKKIDQVSYVDDNEGERTASKAWELALYQHLDAHGVRYLTEEALADSGYKSTPDVVLLDDVFINGQQVKWFDAKNYYGSASTKFFLSKHQKQAERYAREFDGAGALVYRLGFSRELLNKMRPGAAGAGARTGETGGCLLLDRGLLPETPVVSD